METKNMMIFRRVTKLRPERYDSRCGSASQIAGNSELTHRPLIVFSM